MSTVDVVIAGGGPNGLMLAGELALAGVRPVVLERLSERTQENRANGLVGQVVRMLDRRGLYERLADGRPRPAPDYVFGALPLDLAALTDNPLYTLAVPQRRIEQMLEERATELGGEVRRGHELTGLTQDSGGVTVEVAGPAGTYTLRCRYFVGADGGSSRTRKLSGIDFPGVTTDNTVSLTAHVSVPTSIMDSASGGLSVPRYGVIPPFRHHRTERGLFVFAPFPSGQPMVNTTERGTCDAETPLTMEELRESVCRVLGVDVPLGEPEGEGPHLMRRLVGGNTRLADRFRDGRVFLAGDAAHVHSGIGGPGLNLGLQDAVNLGWKLAAVVRGHLPPTVLDSYETERRPAAERVVMHTQAQSALIASGSDVTALRELFLELLRDRNAVQHIADMVAGADLRYDMGSASHPLVGRWAPDLQLQTGNGTVRLAELTRGARPLLLDLTADGGFARELSGYGDRLDVISARASDAPAAMLLRPDGYVAWATSSPRTHDEDVAALRTALQRWCGPPG